MAIPEERRRILQPPASADRELDQWMRDVTDIANNFNLEGNLRHTTSTLTITPEDVSAVAGSAASIVLPSAQSSFGAPKFIFNRGTGIVAVSSESGNVDGVISTTLPRQYDSKTFVSDGTDWFAITDRTVYNVEAFGARGDSSVDDAVSIQAAIDAAPNKGTVLFPSGSTYAISRTTITKPLTVIARDSNFSLIGANAGFTVQGTVDQLNVFGGNFTGSGVSSDLQRAWLIGNDNVSHVSNVHIEGVSTQSCTVGIQVAGSTLTPIETVRVVNCNVSESVGTVGGTGYGIQLHEVRHGAVAGCYVDRCQRHGIYVTQSKHCAVTGNLLRDHRTTINDGSTRAALAIARSDNVAATGNVFDACFDNACGIDTDSDGTQCRNIAVTGNVFSNSSIQDVVVGSTGAASEGTCENIAIVGNTFRRDAGSRPATNVEVNTGLYVTVANNTFFHEADNGASYALIFLRGASAAARTNFVSIKGNTFHATSSPATAYGVELGSNIVGGSSIVDIQDNVLDVENALLLGASNTNTNIRLSNLTSIPTTGTASGTSGDIAFGKPASGTTFLYVCVSANSWMRAALSPF